MEHIYIKKNYKDLPFKICLILILLFIAYSLIEVRQKVKEHYEAFDENPLLFGAKKYDIKEAKVETFSGKIFYFNQNKIWGESKNQSFFKNFSINLSELWVNQT